MIFKKKIFLNEIDSTNNYLIELEKKIKVDEGLVLITDYQNNGRGRIGKTWQSEKAKNLLFSFVLKPTFLPLNKQFFISVITSIAVFDLLQSYTSEKINIKWPNDLLINKNKIAGFLIDFKIHSNKIKNCIVGCGININQKSFSNLDNVTSLSLLTKKKLNRYKILDNFLEIYSDIYCQLIDKKYDEIKIRYLSLVNNYISKTKFNNIESEIVVLDLQNNGDILALVDGVKKNITFSRN